MASKASDTAIIRAARGICSPPTMGRARSRRGCRRTTRRRFPRCPASRPMQLRRRISTLIARARAMIAVSSLSSRVGFSKTWSGVPTMPMSCSKAAISSCSRWHWSKSSRVAQAEQVNATRIEWLAVAACLHCKAANRLPAMPNRRLANWSSVASSGVCGNEGPLGAGDSTSVSRAPSSAIQSSGDAATTSGVRRNGNAGTR